MKNFLKIIIFVWLVGILLSAGCSKKNKWKGEFVGSTIERYEYQDELQQTKGKPENRTQQSYKISLEARGEREAILKINDNCKLQIDIYEKETAYIRTGQTCRVSINGIEDEFVLTGTIFIYEESLRFTLTGEKKDENFKRVYYSFNFSGDRTN